MEEAPAWERIKENAAPLERGRNVRSLEQSLVMDTPEEREEKERMLRHYERLVRPSEQQQHHQQQQQQQTAEEDNEDDPLIHWLSYIKFHQEAFPSDTHAQFLLMERCTRALVRRRQYANDVRFIRVCVTYADKTSFPGDVFKYLHQCKVGTHTALFWVAWAWVAENKGDYAFAEKVFLKGISKEAKPLQMLKQRHKQFQRRMSRHWLNTTSQGQQDELEEDEEGMRRGALGALSDDALRRNDRRTAHQSAASGQTSSAATIMPTFTDRTHHRSAEASRPVNNGSVPKNGGFDIFVDENAPLGADSILDQTQIHHEPREMERERDRRKENTAAAERWNQRGGLVSQSHSSEAAPPAASTTGPTFDVFVDKECQAKLEREKLERRLDWDVARHVRDERTLRQRTEEDVAEKLARDPMRYVRNPSKLADDQGNEQAHKSEKRINALSCGFSKKLVSRDSTGQEQCFEEGRAKARCYSLVGKETNFNLFLPLHHTVAATDDSTMEVDEDDSVDFGRKRLLSTSSSSIPRPPKSLSRKILFDADVSMDSQRPHNTSTASSTVDERDAVGVPTGKDEETINTKLAMKELSMMFSSPALGLGDATDAVARKQRPSSDSQKQEEDGDTATFSIVAGLVKDDANNNSVLVDPDEENDENVAPRNPEARSNSTPGFAGCALRSLEEEEVPMERRILGQCANTHTEPAGGTAAFEIYCDVEEDEDADSQMADRPPRPMLKREATFEIYQDGNDDEKRESGGDTATFSVFGDTLTRIGVDDDKRDSGGDTATFSLVGDTLLVQPGLGKKRDCEGDTATYSIQGETLQGKVATNKRDSDGNTATFSVLGETLKDLDGDKGAPTARRDASFSIYMDDDSVRDLKNQEFRRFGSDKVLAEAPNFGDISRIAPDDGDGTFIDRRPAPSPPLRPTRTSNAMEYAKIHRHDVRSALRQLQYLAHELAMNETVLSRNSNLSSMLSTKGCVHDMPNQYLPRALQKKTSTQGSQIILGDQSGVVKEELGRGAYGIVVLMDVVRGPTSSEIGNCVAVKAQAPTDSLALEYLTLKKIEERVGKHYDLTQLPNVQFPFPRALSFVSLADGGLLGMTAGSKSGMNLVDIANVYRLVERSPVPELVVLHYTARMLKHLEALHWHGKILHCDAKPDNWVLITSSAALDSCEEPIDASDLMLVDFGRSVDLTEAAKDGADPMDVKFCGDAAAEDMSCVAMRKGLGWSFDIDTFGICASAHVLLYGTHIDIEEDMSTRRWRPRKPLRRYWQKEIWTELFDTLLNLDEVTGNATGSRSRSLRSLRNMIEDHLRDQSRELESLLRHQARILPAQRPR